MKYPNLVASILLVFSMTACIKPEADNMEADIIKITLPDSVLIAPPVISNSTVTAFVKLDKMNIKAFAPQFELSSGATISPKTGVPQDFSVPVIYTVHSEDGNWQKQYQVSFLQNTVSGTFKFENWALTSGANYNTPFEIEFGERQDVWASGNSGYSLVAPEKKPEAYPTQRSTESVEGNYAVYLETKSTGSLGAIVGMPIAAGNLFLGSFDGSKSLTAPLEATVFGVPFNKKPIRFTGSYKYRSGGAVTDKNMAQIIPERLDECDIYAVMFKATTAKPNLNGANILADPSVVAIATITDRSTTPGNGYKTFDIPFQYKTQINPADLAAYTYKVAVIFSSSKNGAIFEGAVGSKLLIDDVKIVTE